MPRMNDYAVICRIPDQDDDSCVLVKASTPEVAVRRAADALWHVGCKVWDSRKDCKRENGTDIYVKGVITGAGLHLLEWNE